jgi:hypothetical protein
MRRPMAARSTCLGQDCFRYGKSMGLARSHHQPSTVPAGRRARRWPVREFSTSPPTRGSSTPSWSTAGASIRRRRGPSTSTIRATRAAPALLSRSSAVPEETGATGRQLAFPLGHLSPAEELQPRNFGEAPLVASGHAAARCQSGGGDQQIVCADRLSAARELCPERRVRPRG